MSGKINTVLGSVSTDELGVTLCHEHFVYGFPGYQGDITCGPFDREGFMRELQEYLDSAKEYGLRTVVDATPNDQARDPLLLQHGRERFGIRVRDDPRMTDFHRLDGSARQLRLKDSPDGLHLRQFRHRGSPPSSRIF